MDALTRTRRIDTLRAQMARSDVAVTAIAPTDNLRYLLGFAPHADERMCVLLISPDAAVVLTPGLNAEQISVEVPEFALMRWSDDAGPVGALGRALEAVGAGAAHTVAVDPEMRADHLLMLAAALPAAAMIDATDVIAPLRGSKDADELALIQSAADAADLAMGAAFAALAPGVTELAVGERVAQVFAANGTPVAGAIIGGGPNGAFPHHATGSRALQSGDAVVIDIGGRRANYFSDITRMAFIGEPTERYLEVHGIVEAAVIAALAASRPGARCGDVDAAARAVIDDAGYGDYFVHRTGHGLGLSGHEPPWIMRGNDLELTVGSVHSIEPGIYLPGAFGVRLEEIVQVTEDGCARFSSLPREVHVVH